MLEVLLCILHLKHLLYHCGELLLGEGATLNVGGEAVQLLHVEEGGLEGLLGPDSFDPVASCLYSVLGRVVDTAQQGCAIGSVTAP